MTPRVLAGLIVLMFTLAAASGSAIARQAVQGAGAQEQDKEFLKDAYPKDTPGLTLPIVKRHVIPKYTSAAMRAKIQGEVQVQAIVGPDGKVDRVRVLTSLDKSLGLDQQAIAAAKQWVFEPGKLDGKAVPVAVSLLLEFRLH